MKFSSDLHGNLRKDTLPASPQHLRCARNAGQGTSVMAARVRATRMMAAETAVPPIMRAVSIVIAIVAGVGAEVRGGVGRGVWAICAARPMMAVGQAIFPSILVVKCTAGRPSRCRQRHRRRCRGGLLGRARRLQTLRWLP